LYTSLVIESVPLVYVGLFIFIISQAITVSRQFFWTFSRLKVVNNRLEQINDELQSKNNTINDTNIQLTRLNAELDSLVYRTSHDLRSPITSILTLVEIIKGEQEEVNRNAYLDMQTKTLFRLDALITDTLDFAKNKRMELNFEPVDFNELIQCALQDHVYAENSPYVTKIVEIEQKVKFISDRIRLKIVINNLISNALRYHNRDQEMPYLKILVTVSVSQAEIKIIDNGQGIEEKHLEHIFTMFYRANKATTGSGLGLYIVKDAIEKMGGYIKLESKINVGTEFVFVIPNRTGDEISALLKDTGI
jgi:signal transduction histidine kinase